VVERSDTTGYDSLKSSSTPDGVAVLPPAQRIKIRTAMPSTFFGLHYHLVFATKRREPFIAPAWRSRLHEYLGGTVSGLDGVPQIVGGVADHVHLLVALMTTHCLAGFMRELKKASTIWVQREIGLPKFAWQEGYAAFTVSPSARPAVQEYILNQEEHHRARSFQEEFQQMLAKAGNRIWWAIF
jgi:REP element-mobilizing transposase RayT